MIKPLASFRVAKSMPIVAATARKGVRENRAALEAEASAAIATKHLVTLLVLRCLRIQMLLCDSHAASWTLLGACFLHPLPKGRFGSLGLFPAFSFFYALCVLLARQTLVVGLRPTTQA